MYRLLSSTTLTNNVRWSEHNDLAVIHRNGLEVLTSSPAVDSTGFVHLTWDRAKTAYPPEDTQWVNQRIQSPVTRHMLETGPAQFRSVAWSPVSHGFAEGCGMVALTLDHRCFLYRNQRGPPATTSWKPGVELRPPPENMQDNTGLGMMVDWSPCLRLRRDPVSIIAVGTSTGYLHLWACTGVRTRHLASIQVAQCAVHCMTWSTWHSSHDPAGWDHCTILLATGTRGIASIYRLELGIGELTDEVPVKFIGCTLLRTLFSDEQPWISTLRFIDHEQESLLVAGSMGQVTVVNLTADSSASHCPIATYTIPYASAVTGITWCSVLRTLAVFIADGQMCILRLPTVTSDNSSSPCTPVFDELLTDRLNDYLSQLVRHAYNLHHRKPDDGAQGEDVCKAEYADNAPLSGKRSNFSLSFRGASSSITGQYVAVNVTIRTPFQTHLTAVNDESFVFVFAVDQAFTSLTWAFDQFQSLPPAGPRRTAYMWDLLQLIIDSREAIVSTGVDTEVKLELDTTPSVWTLAMVDERLVEIRDRLRCLDLPDFDISQWIPKNVPRMDSIDNDGRVLEWSRLLRTFLTEYTPFYNQQLLIWIWKRSERVPWLKDLFKSSALEVRQRILLHFLYSCLLVYSWWLRSYPPSSLSNTLKVWLAINLRLAQNHASKVPYLTAATDHLSTTLSQYLPKNQSLSSCLKHWAMLEKCPLCAQSLVVDQLDSTHCPQGHTWARCTVSHLVLAEPTNMSCAVCDAKVLGLFGKQSSRDKGIPNDSVLQWLSNAIDGCVYCGGDFYHKLNIA
ncbi:hypothetical protein IWQ62_000452 [Dispira parvispora]|uniref:Transcription factor IIIC putative zinc-finger domain-containing protein n=1 Tax=Dispira parvispora TaxID=1520584 RepID=A0A9W8E507_9FUNG|nr:hypothetical protein IWQ62_000452 [Dispira parvispora]